MTTCKTCPWRYLLGGSYYCVQGVLEGACSPLSLARVLSDLPCISPSTLCQ